MTNLDPNFEYALTLLVMLLQNEPDVVSETDFGPDVKLIDFVRDETKALLKRTFPERAHLVTDENIMRGIPAE